MDTKVAIFPGAPYSPHLSSSSILLPALSLARRLSSSSLVAHFPLILRLVSFSLASLARLVILSASSSFPHFPFALLVLFVTLHRLLRSIPLLRFVSFSYRSSIRCFTSRLSCFPFSLCSLSLTLSSPLLIFRIVPHRSALPRFIWLSLASPRVGYILPHLSLARSVILPLLFGRCSVFLLVLPLSSLFRFALSSSIVISPSRRLISSASLPHYSLLSTLCIVWCSLSVSPNDTERGQEIKPSAANHVFGFPARQYERQRAVNPKS